MLKPGALELGLAQFTGTEQWTRHALASNMLMTDGVLYLRENADCYWLVDAIASYVAHSPELKGEHFQAWTFERVHEVTKPHLLYVTDGNGDKRLITQEIDYSDFPLPKITLWAVYDGGFKAFVLMLPSEY
jgi:hypothetical protein